MNYDAASFLEGLFRPAGATARTPTPVPEPLGVSVEELPGDWRVEWEERAAVLEYDGGFSRERAEALALAEIVGKMHRFGGRLPFTGRG
jgi:hypothetical protein